MSIRDRFSFLDCGYVDSAKEIFITVIRDNATGIIYLCSKDCITPLLDKNGKPSTSYFRYI